MSEHYTPTVEDIIELRSSLKLSQTKMAEKTGCSLNTWHKWEKGINIMPTYAWGYLTLLIKQEQHVNKREATAIYKRDNNEPVSLEELAKNWDVVEY